MHVIDSHTEGEPTRVVISGGPDLGSGPLSERVKRFREQSDRFRRFVIDEPRGWDALVGALLCEPTDPDCVAGVIFFNNAGYLGMCGHGAIGLAVTLYRLGRIGLGTHRLETPVGVVDFHLMNAHEVTIQNVPAYRFRKEVSLFVDGLGEITGDIAWGGNWFFLVDDFSIPLARERHGELVSASLRIRQALQAQGINGADGADIDHIEFSSPSDRDGVDSVNFVMCPGGAFDRSPCGTGTSAKVACLAADGKLSEGETWVQESSWGGRFLASYRSGGVREDGSPIALPSITGKAYVCSEATLIGQAGDPFGLDLIC